MTHKLLLADDSVTIQRVVELTFSGEDVQVVTVGDGEQAIARIPIERPDIVLADIGDAEAERLRRRGVRQGTARPVAHSGAAAGRRVRAGRRGARAAGEVRRRAGQAVRAAAGRRARARAGRWRRGRRRSRRSLPSRPSPSMAPPPSPRAERAAAGAAAQAASRNWTTTSSGSTRRSPCSTTRSRAVTPMPELDDFRASDVPTLEKLLGSTPLRDTAGPAADVSYASAIAPSMLDADRGHARDAEPAPATPPADGGNVILDAFNALLAMEQGEPRPTSRAHAPLPARRGHHRRAGGRGHAPRARATGARRRPRSGQAGRVRGGRAADSRGNRADQSGSDTKR